MKLTYNQMSSEQIKVKLLMGAIERIMGNYQVAVSSVNHGGYETEYLKDKEFIDKVFMDLNLTSDGRVNKSMKELKNFEDSIKRTKQQMFDVYELGLKK